MNNYYSLLNLFCHKDFYTHFFVCIIRILLFLPNYFNYFNYFTIIPIISKDYYTYYSNWGPMKWIILYCDNLYLLIRIISIKLIYYYTNYSIKMVQGGWHRPNSTSNSLHITGPRHCPRVDEPHPASIASTRPAVARCAWKQVAQVVLNRACFPNRHKRKFPRICSTGMTYSTVFLWSSSYQIWDTIEFNHPAKTKE